MAFIHCFKTKEEEQNKFITEFESCQDLVVFLLSIILNIQDIWIKFCECKKITDRCKVCQFYLIYKDKQYIIYKKFLNYDFPERFHLNLTKDLQEIKKLDSHLICKLFTRNIFIQTETGLKGFLEVIQLQTH